MTDGNGKDKASGAARNGAAPRRGSEAVTMEDVAKVAGVSTITVSRAIRAPEKLSAETLDKVTRAIERTGYVPNLVAGALASSRSRLVAAAVPRISNPVYAETVHSFITPIKRAGYQVLFGESGYTEAEEEELIAAVLSRRPDGILLTGVRHSHRCRRMLMSAGVPVVETWDVTETPIDMAVGFSHVQVGRSVAEVAMACGYGAFALVSVDDERALVRNRAFRATLERAGRGPVHEAVLAGPADLQLGRDGLAALLQRGFAGGAVFCSSDTLAQGVVTEAMVRGLRIPDDLGVIGFGDQSYARSMVPSLTTVKVDRVAMGQAAASLILDRINGISPGHPVVDVGFEIVERDSTARR